MKGPRHVRSGSEGVNCVEHKMKAVHPRVPDTADLVQHMWHS